MSNPTTRERFVEKFGRFMATDANEVKYFKLIGGEVVSENALLSFIESELTLREKEVREEYRGHLRFIWRWISRLNGDKEHDRPEENWRQYVKVLVNYPSAPYQTKDWFEDDLPPTSEDKA